MIALILAMGHSSMVVLAGGEGEMPLLGILLLCALFDEALDLGSLECVRCGGRLLVKLC